MIQVRKSGDRGYFDFGWLKTRHTFSFGEYQDPAFMGFQSLRVINEDIVAPGQGFGTHGHRDMEILSYVISGSLEHRDSLGNGGVLKRDTLQRMRAGTGIRHSEFNPDPGQPLHFFQIWVLPREKGLPPAYEDRSFDPIGAQGKWQLLISPDGSEGSLDIAQDAHLWRVFLKPGEEVTLALPEGESHAYMQLAEGEASVSVLGKGEESAVLRSSDAAALSDVRVVKLKALSLTEALLFGLK